MDRIPEFVVLLQRECQVCSLAGSKGFFCFKYRHVGPTRFWSHSPVWSHSPARCQVIVDRVSHGKTALRMVSPGIVQHYRFGILGVIWGCGSHAELVQYEIAARPRAPAWPTSRQT